MANYYLRESLCFRAGEAIIAVRRELNPDLLIGGTIINAEICK